MRKSKSFYVKNPFAMKEVIITRNNKMYIVDIVAWGTWFTETCFNLKECFNFIRRCLYGRTKY